MPIFALTLLLLSASMHAGWNLLLKRAPEKFIALGWQALISGCLAALLMLFSGFPPPGMRVVALLSAALEVIYFLLLCIAYSDHDFSLVYPIARGAAPAMLALWATLFLHERFTAGGSIGLAMIVLGVLSIGATALLTQRGGAPHLRGILLALSVSLMISLYTFLDGAAVKQTAAQPYGLLIFFATPFVTTPYVIFKYGAKSFLAAWKSQPISILTGGVFGLFGYLLALWAYSFAPLGYSGAVREISAVIGALLGWLFLKERLGGWRALGAAVVFCGALVIAFWG